MTDRYLKFSHSTWGGQLSGLLGLPKPPRLVRATQGFAQTPLASRPALLAASARPRFAPALLQALDAAGADVYVTPDPTGLSAIKSAAAACGVSLKAEPSGEKMECGLLIADVSGVASAADLRVLYDFLNPRLRALATNGRVLLITQAADTLTEVSARAASSAVRGFVRSLGKEVGGKGATANLIEVVPGAEQHLAGALRFLLTEHSAFVCGQVLRLDAGSAEAVSTFCHSLEGKRALVTGAARGIGAAIAQTLAREGAQVIGVDRPQEEGALGSTLAAIGGTGLALDVTAQDASSRIRDEAGELDIVVHNAGVTRDKMLRNMAPHLWDMVLDINLGAIVRINDQLLQGGLRDGARIVCISSIGGIAGNAGQTNYGATKAGVIGYAEALAPRMTESGGTINAVAPGFIETNMTAAMPTVPREVGGRLNALSQGGTPIDIAEAVTFFCSPLSAGFNGQTLRVCGQNFVGQ